MKSVLSRTQCISLLALIFISGAGHSKELNMSLGGGWPYALVPTVAIEHRGLEFFANYKIGLDDGFTLGVEKQFEHHTYGIFVGALGARKTRENCDLDSTCPPFRIALTDRKSTQGIGFSYEYRFSSTRQGWALRVEAGYGHESKTDANRFDGNLQLVHHF